MSCTIQSSVQFGVYYFVGMLGVWCMWRSTRYQHTEYITGANARIWTDGPQTQSAPVPHQF